MAKSETKTSGYALADDIARPCFAGIENKRGFEVYQHLRDFVLEILTAPEKAKPFLADEKHFQIVGDFQPLDRAYIDNFTLCASLKIKAPDIYGEMLPIIDRHVRPRRKEDEGLTRFYQECGGFLALMLNHYEGVTLRQSMHLAVHLTRFSESTLEKSYRGRMEDLKNKLPKELLTPPLSLAALYWTLPAKKIDPDNLRPFKKNIRSENEIKKTISAYWRFTGRVVRHYHEKILQYLKKNPGKIIFETAKVCGINFPLSEQDLQKPSHLSALFVMGTAAMIEIRPDAIEKLDDDLKLIA